MPFSSIIEIQYQEIVDDQISKVTFTDPADFDLFCEAARQLLSTEQATPESKDHDELVLLPESTHYEELVLLKELIDGFDLYATDAVVNMMHRVKLGASRQTHYTDIPAFTSVNQATGEAKIIEAKEEYKKIILQQINLNITRLAALSVEQRQHYIADQRERRELAANTHQRMREAKPPVGEARTLSEEERLLEEQERERRELAANIHQRMREARPTVDEAHTISEEEKRSSGSLIPDGLLTEILQQERELLQRLAALPTASSVSQPYRPVQSSLAPLSQEEQNFFSRLDPVLRSNELDLSSMAIRRSVLDNWLLFPPRRRSQFRPMFVGPTTREQKVRTALRKIEMREEELMEEAARGIDVSKEVLKASWVALSRDDLFSEVKKATLIYLVKGSVENHPQLNPVAELPVEQRLSPLQAIQEINGLYGARVACLREFYREGLSGDLLRSLRAGRFDPGVLRILIRDQNIPPREAIEQINALPEGEVERYFQTLRPQRFRP